MENTHTQNGMLLSTQTVAFKIPIPTERNQGFLGKWMSPGLGHCLLQKKQRSYQRLLEFYQKKTGANAKVTPIDQKCVTVSIQRNNNYNNKLKCIKYIF